MTFYLIAQVASRCLKSIQHRRFGQEGAIYSVAALSKGIHKNATQFQFCELFICGI